jgi:outer membrane lipoprotein SlyB
LFARPFPLQRNVNPFTFPCPWLNKAGSAAENLLRNRAVFCSVNSQRQLIMKKLHTVLVAFAVSATTPAVAVDTDAVLGGAIGGGVGAAVGSEVGGREGAIAGGAIGAAIGTAVATDDDDHHQARRERKPEVIYVEQHHHDGPPGHAYGHRIPPGHAKHRKHKHR